MPPETKYAKTADGVHVAYQVVGDGPIDLAFVMGWTSNIEAMWEEPSLARFLNRLASFCRLIIFDKRGVGLSDRVPDTALPTLETRMDDVRAVMDAAGWERAVVFGVSEGGPLSILFAATYPERTIGLVLFGTSPRQVGGTEAEHREYVEDVDRSWGTVEFAKKQLRAWAAPSLADDDRMAQWLASYLRRAASPSAAIALSQMNRGMDVRSALPAIHVPTLVLGRTGDLDFPIEDTRQMASDIPGARMVELPGIDHFFWVGDQDTLLGEIERFVKEVRDEEAELDRVLATVLFTDIVSSTEKAAALGDRAWRELLEAHHRKVRALLGRFRGREVDTAGDGFLVTFDGPIRAVRCALAAGETVRDLGLEIRAGLHTGEVELVGDNVQGIAVHIGARVASLANPSEVLVSSTVKDLVAGSSLEFEDRGEHELKGVPGLWRVYRALT
ncbi:MAG: adenylate/guanylate cyclase domain-containing protein [Actinobacteria bacterium]|nr:adenylate/guanylate cyclase domain-containing protein [Actinomycetota bacterium]